MREVWEVKMDDVSTKTALPSLPHGVCHHCSFGDSEGAVIVVGGMGREDCEARTWALQRGAEAWRQGPSLPFAAFRAKAVSEGSCALVLGGDREDEEGEWRSLAEVQRVDFEGVSPCVEAPSMISPRSYFAAARNESSGDVVVAGGRGSDDRPSALVEVLRDEKWSALPSLPSPLCECEGVMLGEDFVVLGGRGDDERITAEVHALRVVGGDIGASSWRALPPMLTPRRDFGAAVIGSSIVVLGGYGERGVVEESAEVFDEIEQRWRTLPLRLGVYGCGVAVVSSPLLAPLRDV